MKDSFEKNHLIVEKVREISERNGVSMSQVALRWVAENSRITSVISGIKSVSQIEDNIGCLNFNIGADDAEFFNTEIKDH